MENPWPASTVQAAKKPSAGPRSPRKSAKPGLSILHFPIQPPFAVSLPELWLSSPEEYPPRRP